MRKLKNWAYFHLWSSTVQKKCERERISKQVRESAKNGKRGSKRWQRHCIVLLAQKRAGNTFTQRRPSPQISLGFTAATTFISTLHCRSCSSVCASAPVSPYLHYCSFAGEWRLERRHSAWTENPNTFVSLTRTNEQFVQYFSWAASAACLVWAEGPWQIAFKFLRCAVNVPVLSTHGHQ